MAARNTLNHWLSDQTWDATIYEIPFCCLWTERLRTLTRNLRRSGFLPSLTGQWVQFYHGFKEMHPMPIPYLTNLYMIVKEYEEEYLYGDDGYGFDPRGYT